MAMSDCIKCWDTPCRCGHSYLDWSEKDLEDHIKMLQSVLDKKRLTVFRSEEDIDVRLQPNSQILAKYHEMIALRQNTKSIHLAVAMIHDSGFVSLTVKHDGLVKLTLTESGKSYVMPKAVYNDLRLNPVERVVVINHHKHHYIIKSKAAISRPE